MEIWTQPLPEDPTKFVSYLYYNERLNTYREYGGINIPQFSKMTDDFECVEEYMLRAHIAEKLHFGRDDELTLNRVLPRPIHPFTIKKVYFNPESQVLTVHTQQKKFTMTIKSFTQDYECMYQSLE
eukprot:4247711-Pleurochrysis_carterae.AAC.1